MTDQTIPAEKVRAIHELIAPVIKGMSKSEIRELVLDPIVNYSPQPTTGLLGRWAKHPEYGDVLFIMDKTIEAGEIVVAYTQNDGDTQTAIVRLADLTFPHQATRPEDVPAGEAWRVRHCEDGEFNAVKTSGPFPWRFFNPEIEEHDGFQNRSITLVAPLTPERTGKSDSDLQTRYDELEQKYAELDRKYFDLSVELSIEQQANGSRNDWGDEQPSTPRTVRDPEEYDALPVGSQVQFECDPFWEKGDDGLWRGRPEGEGHTLQTRVTRTVVRYGWGDEQPAWRIEHDHKNLSAGEYIIDQSGDDGTVTKKDEKRGWWLTDSMALGTKTEAPFIVFPNRDAATPEAIEEAKKARDKEMDK